MHNTQQRKKKKTWYQTQSLWRGGGEGGLPKCSYSSFEAVCIGNNKPFPVNKKFWEVTLEPFTVLKERRQYIVDNQA